MSNPPAVFDGFWAGFEDPAIGAPTLIETPEYVDTVTLAFTGPADNNTYTTNYLCKYYPAEKIKAWVKQLQARGQKVLMSVYDNPNHPWAKVDIPVFVKNAIPIIMEEWGADGVDIDGESGDATAEDFIQVILEFRKALGPVGSPKSILTFDTFAFSAQDQQILKATKDDLDWINLMAYFRSYDSMVTLFEQYATLIDPSKITIGVKPGKGWADQHTDLDEVKKLAAYQPKGARKKGMMLYTLSRDIPHFTGHPLFTWTTAIHDNQA